MPIGFDGKGERRLTTTTGTHQIDMSPDTRFYIDRWSAVGQPRQVELWATGGKLLKKLEDNARVTQWLAHATPTRRPRSLRFTTSDSARIDASVIKPWPFDSTRRYPMVFAIYGGPGSQQVYNSFSTSALVAVARAAGLHRGGREQPRHEQLRQRVHEDDVQAPRLLGGARLRRDRALPRAPRAGPTGRASPSSGRATAATARCTRWRCTPTSSASGIANSPVTDWRLYDTIYTERYMGLLGDNAAGYDSSSAIKHAGQIKGHLLLIHSMMDDNVHPQNTMQLLTALTRRPHRRRAAHLSAGASRGGLQRAERIPDLPGDGGFPGALPQGDGGRDGQRGALSAGARRHRNVWRPAHVSRRNLETRLRVSGTASRRRESTSTGATYGNNDEGRAALELRGATGSRRRLRPESPAWSDLRRASTAAGARRGHRRRPGARDSSGSADSGAGAERNSVGARAMGGARARVPQLESRSLAPRPAGVVLGRGTLAVADEQPRDTSKPRR